MRARRRCDATRRASAPRSGARAALPWLLIAGLAALGACSSSPAKESKRETAPAPDVTAGSSGTEAATARPTVKPDAGHGDEALRGGSEYKPLDDDESWKAEPGYPRVPESPGTDEPAPNEPARAVQIGDVTLGTTPPGVILPAEVRVAVASIRAGKLARRVVLLRHLSRALGKGSGVESVVALARLDAVAKDPADLADLARVAAAQGAHLLLIEERADDATEPTLALVVHAPSGTVLGCARGSGEKPTSSDRSGVSRLAALVRSVR